MAGVPKYLLRRAITPDWVLTSAALALTLLVYGALLLLPKYHPITRVDSTRKSPGVTLLNQSGLPEDEWKYLVYWATVHDPSQISRADAHSGYMAFLERHRIRSIESPSEEVATKKSDIPTLPPLPNYIVLEPAGESNVKSYRGASSDFGAFHPIPPVRELRVTDAEGELLHLSKLRLPLVESSTIVHPTIVAVRKSGDLTRQHLLESSGIPALDIAVCEAVAAENFENTKTIIVYWPEMTQKENAQ
ncbi:MAG: hypothetical protein LBM70_01715 [Victivallales bacterium]|jgi:hypothetical protein|nr:hypothetical protein [Victivallales bacterium]